MKMWRQGHVFLKYVLKFLFNAYIRQHTRALSNSPLGVVTTAWVWWQQCVWEATLSGGRAAWIWGSVLISVGAGHMVGPPFEVSVEGIIFMRWRGSPSRGRPHFLTGRREKCSASNRSASKLFKVVLFKKPGHSDGSQNGFRDFRFLYGKCVLHSYFYRLKNYGSFSTNIIAKPLQKGSYSLYLQGINFFTLDERVLCLSLVTVHSQSKSILYVFFGVFFLANPISTSLFVV